MADDNNEEASYLSQIQCLEQQLESSQLLCQEMEEQNIDLASKCSAMERDQKNITKPLKRDLAAREEAKFEVLDLMDHQRETAKQDVEALKLQHSELMQKLQKRLDEVTSQRGMLELKFDEQQKQVGVDIRSVEKQLLNQNEEPEASVLGLKVTERDITVPMLKRKVRERVRAKLSDLAKQESASHQRSLEHLHLLLTESTLLQEEHDSLERKQLNTFKLMTNLKKKVVLANAEILTNQKTVIRLTRSCIHLQTMLNRQSIIHKKQQQDKQATVETLSRDLDSVFAEYGKVTAKFKQLGAELKKPKTRRSQESDGVKKEISPHVRIVKAGDTRNESTILQTLFEYLDDAETDSKLWDETEKTNPGPLRTGVSPGTRKLSVQTSSSSAP